MDGATLIHQGRQRQVSAEGWTLEHDDEHVMGELIGAALSYAGFSLEQVTDGEIEAGSEFEYWPDWDFKWWKPSDDPIRNLIKAGALIAAEIDRLQRAPQPPVGKEGHHE